MLIARITNSIVATAKNSAYEGHKILEAAPEGLDGELQPNAAPIVALDLVDAGVGDRVLICQEGRWARAAIGDMSAPVRSMIVAIVEGIELSQDIPAPPTSTT